MAPEPSILMVRSFMMVQDQMSNNSHENFFLPRVHGDDGWLERLGTVLANI